MVIKKKEVLKLFTKFLIYSLNSVKLSIVFKAFLRNLKEK